MFFINLCPVTALVQRYKKYLGGLKDRKVVGLIWTELIIVNKLLTVRDNNLAMRTPICQRGQIIWQVTFVLSLIIKASSWI
jgi:hypothetical protein